MGNPKNKKEKKRAKGTVYTCELCRGTESDKPIVACDQCDKWYHFACVGIKSIGRKDSWICAKCEPPKTPQSSTSEQSIPTVVNQMNTTFPSKDREEIINESSKETTSDYNLTYDRNHPNQLDQRSTIAASFSSRISRTSSMTSSRQRIQLELIEEERQLQEQRDARYLEKKLQILMKHQDVDKNTGSSRNTNVRTWIENQNHDKQTSRHRQPTDAEKTVQQRVDELNFDTSIKSKLMEPSMKARTATEKRSVSPIIGLYRCEICHMVGEEKSFVKCYLCPAKAHHVCMETMYIDKELNWICFKCKDPHFKPNTYKENASQFVHTIVDKPVTKVPSMKPKQKSRSVCEQTKASTTWCRECGIIDDKQPFIACNTCGEFFHVLCMKSTTINKNVLWMCTRCKGPQYSSMDPENAKYHQPSTSFANQGQTVPSMNISPKTNVFPQQLPVQYGLESVPGEICTLTSAQIAARHVVTKDLPIFLGKPVQWPMFVSRFNNSTTLCGYSNSENLDRLQKCLKGKALDAVRSRLLTAEAVPEIMETLRMLYGRPELIVEDLMSQIRSEPPPIADKLNTLVDFALSVRNVCATLEQANLNHHLSNPALLKELVDKLPTITKIEWAKHQANVKDVTLSTLGEFLYDLAKVISTVTEPTVPKEPKSHKMNTKNDSERSNKDKDPDWGDSKSHNWRKDSENVNVHRRSQSNKAAVQSHSTTTTNNSSNQSCIICSNKCENLEVCSKFNSHDVEQRWKDIYNNKLCRKCLKRHGRYCSSTKNCGVNGCVFKHHALLHNDKKHIRTSTPNNPESTERSVHHAHSTFDRNILLRIVPVTLYFNDRKLQTFAYLDDGSDVTLVSERIAKAMDIQGVKKPLCLFWTSDIHRKEKGSQLVNVEISGRDENSQRFSLNGIRTVENLGLPSQSLIMDELVQKFPYLQEAVLLDYVDAIPEVLIGSDNASLNAQQRLVEGEINQPVASQCRLGWTINGRIDNKYPNKVIVNPHAKLCPYYIQADEDLHQQVKDHFSIENFGVLVNNSLNLSSKEDERALELLNKFTKRTNGRYETSLLWKYDSFELPNSYQMALKR